MDIELFTALSKYPFNFENNFYSSVELKQNKTCIERCQEKDCLNLLSNNVNLTEYNCSKRFDNVLLIVGDLKFVINGLIYSTNTQIPPGTKAVRKAYVCERDSVLLFANKIMEIEKHLIKRENETTVKNFSIFHDFKTSMNIFYKCTEDIIYGFAGDTFEQKLQNTGRSYQDLYHALSLITSQLRMIDIFINPKSIEFGNKRNINIYQLFDKLIKLFERLAERKREVKIKLLPASWINNSFCYDSIEFIPLILLDNALKYSMPDSDIEVKIEQHFGKVKVSVRSIGPFVSEENKDKIFEKFFRDESGKAFSKEGIGMGLWIAQEILAAHHGKLYYYRDPNEFRPIGLNIFSFDLPTLV